MIRVLFGSALPLLSIGAAAGFLGGDIVTGPRGAPLMVSAPMAPGLHQASFDGSACSPTLLFSENAAPDQGSADAFSGTRIIGFALRTNDEGLAIGVEDFPGGAGTAHESVLLFFDREGRLVAAENPAQHLVAGEIGDCLAMPAPAEPGPI